jgi:hypothetical protein
MPLDYGDQSYYPSWKVRLIVRLEEFDAQTVKAKVPNKLTKNLNGVLDDSATLETIPDPENPGRFIVQPKGGAPAQNVLVPEASDDGLTQVVSGIIPKNFSWKQAGFRTASELKLQIRWSDLPLDPRCIRSCAVEFYLGTVTALEYAQGVQGMLRGNAISPGVPNAAEPLNVIADKYLDASGNQRTNLRFTGWVEDFKATWSEDQPMIELSCKDNSSLLMNQIAPPKVTIGGEEPLDKAVATYLANFPQFSGFSVEFRGESGDTAPKLKDVLAGTAFRPKLGPQPSKGAGSDDLQVWDYITDVCGAVGLVNFIDGTTIVLARPSTVLDGQAQRRSDDPYAGRKLASGDYPSRALIFGQNLNSMEVSRKYGTCEAKNIEVRCWSPRRKQILVSRYPQKKDRIPSTSPGTDKADEKWSIIRVKGVEDKATLDQIAKDYYNGRNRNEIELVLKTKNFASFGGGNEDPDLLDLKAGDPIEVLVNRDRFGNVTGSDAQGNPNIGEAQLTAAGANEKFLTDLGYTKGFASAYAAAYKNAGFQRLFRLREMDVTGDVDEGVSFELRVVNFIQVRGEPAT